MNIFYLHYKQKKCARYHVDRHVVKMILETCQLLCTAIWLSGGTAHCKPTHQNHPSAVWARTNKNNWLWLKGLGLALCREYTFRYNKVHSLQSVLEELQVPDLPDEDFFPPPQAMPDMYKDEDAIKAYRNYYIHGKIHLHHHKTRHAWKNRTIPKFILRVTGGKRKDEMENEKKD